MTKFRKSLPAAACISLLAGILLVAACGKNTHEYAMDGVNAAEQAVLSEPVAVADENIAIERKIVKEGDLAFETDDLVHAQRDLDSLIKRHKGYVTSDQSFHASGRESRSLVVRVPAGNFDVLVSDVGGIAQRIDHRNIRTQDVTEEFIDIEARVRTKKELESRYLKLLERAANVEEILAIEQQIGTLRTDIEATEGRLRYLSSQSDLSTLNITFYKSISTTEEFGYRLKNGFGNGWENFVDFVIWLINGWPFLILLIAALWGWRRWRTTRRRRIEATGLKTD